MNRYKIPLCFLLVWILSSCGDSTSAEDKFAASLQKKWKWQSTTRITIAGGTTITPDSIKTQYILDLTGVHSIRLQRNDTLQFSGHYSLNYETSDKNWYLTIDLPSLTDSLSPPLFEEVTYIPTISGKQLTFDLPNAGVSDYGGNATFTSEW